jgi:hypothetical protein
MITAFAVPFLAAVGLALLAPTAARRLPARTAVWSLTVAAVATVVGTWVSIGGILAATFGQLPFLAAQGHWAPRVVGRFAPFPFVLCIGASVVVALVAARAVFSTGMDARRLLHAWSACRKSPRTLLVLPDEDRYAYAVPGWPGRIVTSAGLLRDLDPAQRRAVLAHEQAHLDAHHELHLIVAKFASVANPLLFTLPAAVRLACERWADDSAAAAVGDRRTVAVAIARAGGAATNGLMTFAAGGSDVPARVAALLSPPQHRRAWLIEVALVGAALVTTAAACWMYRDVDRIFDAAALNG